MPDELRDGIIGLHTRQIGRVVELLISHIYDFHDSDNIHFDLKDGNTRIEIKGSRVYKKNKLKFTKSNLYETIVNSSNRNRLIKQKDVTNYDFDCNIQQIKISYFDKLYYVLFFYDIIEVFKIDSKEIKNDSNIQYSNKQHKGNVGEGQFHINQRTYKHHKNRYFLKTLTYEELKNKLTKN